MVIIGDVSFLSVKRRLTAYNLFNGINLKVKSLLKEEFDLYYFTYTEEALVHSSYVFEPNYKELPYEDNVSDAVYGIAISKISEIVDFGEDIIIVAERDWYKYYEKFVKALVDVLQDNDVYTLGYGEVVDDEYLKNHLYQILDIESLDIDDEYINNLEED